MGPIELALKYMGILFSGGDLDELSSLFAEDFTFSGPFYEFDSAEGYIKSLKSNPPDGFDYELIDSFENETTACLVYQFTKPGVSTPMAQVFETDRGKISKILLVFDTGAFT